jgi:hypothetical protein
VLLVIVAINLLDTYVSMKYEVDEFKAMNNVSEAILDKEKYLKKLIFLLWSIGIYLIGNLVMLVRLIIKEN